MSGTKKTSSSLQSKSLKGKLKSRNPLSLNPLMKKSHAHTKSPKAERAKDKQALKKQLQQRDKSE